MNKKGWIVIAVIGILFIAYQTLKQPHNPGLPVPKRSALSQSQISDRYEASKGLIEEAKQVGLVVDEKDDDTLVVDKTAWSLVDYESKKTLVKALAVYDAGGNRPAADKFYYITGHKTGKELARLYAPFGDLEIAGAN